MTRRSVTREVVKETPPEVSQPINIKYRPTKLSEVLGQDHVVKSIEAQLKRDNPMHAYLFTGPAGTGKTTLARIIAAHFKASPQNIVEIDAATHTGVDDMREVTASMRYQGFGANPTKVFIIDECHRLTKNAWESLLKATEEPPPHVFFFFCTTESGKVPQTIVTRCAQYTLAPVKFDPLMDLLEKVCESEDFRTSNKILEMIARACGGSPREALTMLSIVYDVEDMEEAAILLASPSENKEVIDLCRALVQGKLDWKSLTTTLKSMPEMPAESIRIVIVNYLAACLMGSNSDKQTTRLLDMVSVFSKPYNTSDKMAPLLLSFGDLIFA